MKWKLIVITLFTIIIGTSCSGTINKWPNGMTPFFAECEGEGELIQIRNMLKENDNLVTEVGNIMIEESQP